MLFNSLQFWLFFVVVVAVYRTLQHRNQNWFLLGASYFFYSCWDWRFLSLILISTIVDFLVGLQLSKTDNPIRRRWLLAVSVFVNLGTLGVFKYYNFFAGELDQLLNTLGFSASMNSLQILLPVGISFYTFQTLGYTIDVFRRRNNCSTDLLNFALYVAFFPQLVAGPIERSERLLGQISSPRSANAWDFRVGLYLILSGLFKKIVIADNMAPIVNAIFNQDSADVSGPEIIVAVYAFAFQIYGDFSGYSSIAQGIARWLGFDLIDNFKHPYFATSPSEFWARWHISLSSWLRDYLYISLGGNRGGTARTLRNLNATMILGGLWHGANWTFLIWGALHGIWLSIFRVASSAKASITLPVGAQDSKGPCGTAQSQTSGIGWMTILRTVLLFHLVCAGWLFFRAESLTQAWEFLYLCVSKPEVTAFTIAGIANLAFFLLPLLVFELWLETKKDLLAVLNVGWIWRAAVYGYFFWMVIVFKPGEPSEFIYFQF